MVGSRVGVRLTVVRTRGHHLQHVDFPRKSLAAPTPTMLRIVGGMSSTPTQFFAIRKSGCRTSSQNTSSNITPTTAHYLTLMLSTRKKRAFQPRLRRNLTTTLPGVSRGTFTMALASQTFYKQPPFKSFHEKLISVAQATGVFGKAWTASSNALNLLRTLKSWNEKLGPRRNYSKPWKKTQMIVAPSRSASAYCQSWQ